MVIDLVRCKICKTKDIKEDWIRIIKHKNFEVFDIDIFCSESCYNKFMEDNK